MTIAKNETKRLTFYVFWVFLTSNKLRKKSVIRFLSYYIIVRKPSQNIAEKRCDYLQCIILLFADHGKNEAKSKGVWRPESPKIQKNHIYTTFRRQWNNAFMILWLFRTSNLQLKTRLFLGFADTTREF